MQEWIELGNKLNTYLRPETFPLAVKLYKKGEEVPAGLRKPRVTLSLCQMMSICRQSGQSMVATPKELVCHAVAFLGMTDYKEEAWKGFCDVFATDMLLGMYSDKLEPLKKANYDFPRLRDKDHQAIACSPLERTKIAPDLVMVYGNPAQIFRIFHAIVWHKEDAAYQDVRIPFGDMTCTYGMSKALLTGDPQFVFPGYGERVVSYVKDHELAFVIPGPKLAQVVDGLEKTHRGRIPMRYPTPFMLEKAAEMAAGDLKAMEKLRE